MPQPYSLRTPHAPMPTGMRADRVRALRRRPFPRQARTARGPPGLRPHGVLTCARVASFIPLVADLGLLGTVKGALPIALPFGTAATERGQGQEDARREHGGNDAQDAGEPRRVSTPVSCGPGLVRIVSVE